MTNILVVDDVEDTADNIARLLKRAGHHVMCCYSERDANLILKHNAFDVLVTDMWMEQPLSGMFLVQHAKSLDPDIEVIVLTAYGDIQTAVSAMKHGAFDFVEKTTEASGKKDFFDKITELVNSCIHSHPGKERYQIYKKSSAYRASSREVELLRQQKSTYELFVDDETGHVFVSAEAVDVRDLAYRLLVYMIENQGALRSPIQIYHDVWADPDTYVIAERDEKLIQDRVKTRISNLRARLNSQHIQITNRNKRYGLSLPDGIEFCLIREIR